MKSAGNPVKESAEGAIISVNVQPRASRAEICGIQGDELKIRLTSPPVDDAANTQCTELIAKKLKIAKGSVEIIHGHKSRHKTVRVSCVDALTIFNTLITHEK